MNTNGTNAYNPFSYTCSDINIVNNKGRYGNKCGSDNKQYSDRSQSEAMSPGVILHLYWTCYC